MSDAEVVRELDQSSPQAKWASKMQAQGKCRCCGQPRPVNPETGQFELKQHCRACQDKVNAYHNAYNKAKRDAKKAVIQAAAEVPVVTPEVNPAYGYPDPIGGTSNADSTNS